MLDVAIIGAGVTGLTSAIALTSRGLRPHVFAAERAEDSTSGAAAAIWYPYDTGTQADAIEWALITYRRLLDIADDASAGVSPIELRSCVHTTTIDVPAWTSSVSFRALGRDELPEEFHAGYAMTVPLMDTTHYLPWLRARLADAGGSITYVAPLGSLEEVDRSFALIVNCTGYGARALTGDDELEPHRGQSVLAAPLDVPDVQHAFVSLDDPLTYIIPRTSDCILGGVNEVSESTEVDPEASARILERCSRTFGAALRSPIVALGARVGLRPFRRSGVRLEATRLRDGRTVIHNYGHGGAGFTLAWGCAERCAELAIAAVSSLR